MVDNSFGQRKYSLLMQYLVLIRFRCPGVMLSSQRCVIPDVLVAFDN